MNKDIAQI